MTNEEIKKAAESYAENFRYSIEQGGWHYQKIQDFIAGADFMVSQSKEARYKEALEKIADLCGDDETRSAPRIATEALNNK